MLQFSSFFHVFLLKCVDKIVFIKYYLYLWSEKNIIANDPLAQLAEHLTFNQGVRSSNLRWVTKTIVTIVAMVFYCLNKAVNK